tara:strand:- start:1367 stop:1489 length:123 start_codon:yes stop_codon:yes gene_type:complete
MLRTSVDVAVNLGIRRAATSSGRWRRRRRRRRMSFKKQKS